MVPVVYTCSIAWTASSLVNCHIISTAAIVLVCNFIISPSCHIFINIFLYLFNDPYFNITITWVAASVPDHSCSPDLSGWWVTPWHYDKCQMAPCCPPSLGRLPVWLAGSSGSAHVCTDLIRSSSGFHKRVSPPSQAVPACYPSYFGLVAYCNYEHEPSKPSKCLPNIIIIIWNFSLYSCIKFLKSPSRFRSMTGSCLPISEIFMQKLLTFNVPNI